MTEHEEYQHPAPDWVTWFTLPRFLLLLAALICAEYPEIVTGTHSFFYRDFGLYSYPVAHYTQASLAHSEIPLWNPLNNCGTPFLAQWNTTVCYPLSLIYIVLPQPWSVNYFCLVHLLIAGAAMYSLAHRWTQNRFAASIAGLAYALSGLMFNQIMYFSHLAALAWMPCVILCLERAWQHGGRRLALAALVGAVQMLSGSPEVILMTWLLAVSLWVGQFLLQPLRPAEKALLRFAGVAILVFGISAFQLLPFFELLQNSSRSAGADNGEWAMPLWGAANLVVPMFRTSPSLVGVYSQFEQQWTSSYYLGIGVLALALAAVLAWESRARWLVGIAGLGLVLALGDAGYLLHWIKKVIPAIGFARYPIKFVILTAFALPLLAAYVVNNADQPKVKNFRLLRRSLWGAGVVLLVAIVGVVSYARANPRSDELLRVVSISGMTRAVFLVLTVGGVLMLNRIATMRARRWLGIGIVILVAADLLTHTARQNPVVPNSVYLGESPVTMLPVPSAGKSRAMVSHFAQTWLGNTATPDPLTYYTGMRSALYDNCNLLDGIPKVNGFYTLYLRDFVAVRALLYEPTNFIPGLADFVGVEQITAPGELFRWSARKTFMLLVTAGQLPVFASQTNTLRAIGSPEFDPRRVVYLPEESRGSVLVTNAAKVELGPVGFAAHTVAVKVRAETPALVVFAQCHYPCWQAYVDGVKTVLLQANAAFQAVQVPAGEHEVRLVYEDRMFSWGVCISLAALLTTLWWMTEWQGRKSAVIKPTPPPTAEEKGIISKPVS